MYEKEILAGHRDNPPEIECELNVEQSRQWYKEGIETLFKEAINGNPLPKNEK